jgi:predicted secreted Zn-dependent protease
VNGSNVNEAIANSHIDCNGGTWQGCTSWDFSYSGFQENVSVSNSGNTTTATATTPSNFQSTATATITLPKWTGRDSASTAEKARWDAFVARLKVHEEGHVTTAKGSLTQLRNDLLDVRATGNGPNQAAAVRAAKSAYEAAFQGAFQAGIERAHNNDVLYDLITVHGACQSGACQ